MAANSCWISIDALVFSYAFARSGRAIFLDAAPGESAFGRTGTRATERLFSRSLVLFERMELAHRDDVALGGVLFCEERAHVSDEAASNSGRES